jgi:hypothetical protein
MRFEDQLKGGDLRSLGISNEIAASIHEQASFDNLFACFYHPDRLVAMRSIDAVEKITRQAPQYLQPHKTELTALIHQACTKEFKWHLPLLIVRLHLSETEYGDVWTTLTSWALDRNESRIVRVNAIQGLHDLLKQHPDLKTDYNQTIETLNNEKVPSIRARISKLEKVRLPSS